MVYEDDGSVWSHSDALNLDLRWLDGELRFRDSVSGQWLLTYQEQQEQAERERDGRLAEAARANAAEQRAARLEAELRRLRGQ